MPWEMFPKEVDYKPLAKQYPEVPRTIISFIRNSIEQQLIKYLSKRDALKDGETNPFRLVEIEKDWGSRHMFRAPYSFNEKTWLVSLPIGPHDIQKFEPEMAGHEKVLSERHPDIMLSEKEEAVSLLLEAIDWNAGNKKDLPHGTVKKARAKFDGKVGEEFFPPCIKAILEGMSDGRKRSIFTLANFLRTMNWQWSEIEEKIYQWNEKNKPPLPRTVVSGHLKSIERSPKTPANCVSGMYYTDIGICRPD
jgi:hypothetical protein